MMVSITSCLQELLTFVHLKSHFLASERYTNFASAGASLSHVLFLFDICFSVSNWSEAQVDQYTGCAPFNRSFFFEIYCILGRAV